MPSLASTSHRPPTLAYICISPAVLEQSPSCHLALRNPKSCASRWSLSCLPVQAVPLAGWPRLSFLGPHSAHTGRAMRRCSKSLPTPQRPAAPVQRLCCLWHMPPGGTLRAQDTHRALDQSPLCVLGGSACPHQTQAGTVAKHSLSAHPTGKWLRRIVALPSLVCMPPQPRRGLGCGAIQAARPCGTARWAAGREGPMTLAGRQPHFLSRSYCPAQATPTTAWWVNTRSPLQIPEHMPKQLGLWLPNPFNSPT